MVDFAPVDFDPFEAMMPVDYDPFAAEKFVNPTVKKTLGNLATLPQRAIEGAAHDVQHLGEADYQREAIAPAMDTALMMMPGGIAGAGKEAGMVLGSGPRLKNFFAGESLKDIEQTAEGLWQTNSGKMKGVNAQLGRMRQMGIPRGDWTAAELDQVESLIKEKAKKPFMSQAKQDRAAEKAADEAEKNIGFKPVDHDPFSEKP